MDIKAIINVYKSILTTDELLVNGKEYLESQLKNEKNFSFKSC